MLDNPKYRNGATMIEGRIPTTTGGAKHQTQKSGRMCQEMKYGNWKETRYIRQGQYIR